MKQMRISSIGGILRFLSKTLTLLVALLSLSGSVKAQDNAYFFYGPEGPEYFTLSTDRIIIGIYDQGQIGKISQIMAEEPALERLEDYMVLPYSKLIVANVTMDMDEEALLALLSRLETHPEISYANPFLRYKDGTLQGITSRILIKLKSNDDFRLLEEIAASMGAVITESNRFQRNLYHLDVDKHSDGNALELANRMHETGRFKFAEPAFLIIQEDHNTNDTWIDWQWSLNNTGSADQGSGTAGADMSVFDAWNITTGSPNIRVAVMDTGTDTAHVDLAGNMVSGFDATDRGGTAQDSRGNNSWDHPNDAHGTACAGIVAAVGNNSEGIAGVAYTSRLIPIRHAYRNSAGTRFGNNQWSADGISWAYLNGADIISNSWGGGGSSSAINDAIDDAVAGGRNGLGSIVMASSGNNNNNVAYPANYANVIAVGATSMCDTRKRSSSNSANVNPGNSTDPLGTSCDGEGWWGSNFGADIDIGAPGVRIYTTDITGTFGYVNGDYTATFNGTSSACPNAAGVMALILSVNPTLTGAQARTRIESTCDKVGGYTYDNSNANKTSDTWSNDLGYGRINAFTALLNTCVVTTNTSVSQVTCLGFSNGTVTVSAANGTGPYSYRLWNENISVSNVSGVFNNLPADTYWVQATDASDRLSCSEQVTVTEPFLLLEVSIDTSDYNGYAIACFGGSNGWSTATASGGTPNYSYSWSNGHNGALNSNLTIGTYSVTVTDANSCTATRQVTLHQPPLLEVSIDTSDYNGYAIACFGGSDGWAEATATGGVPTYSYSWSNGYDGALISNLTIGTYSVTVTDANSCTATRQVTLHQPPPLEIEAGSNQTIFYYNPLDACADLEATGMTGGVEPYTITWSVNGNDIGSGENINVCMANKVDTVTTVVYTVTIEDANGCTETDELSVCYVDIRCQQGNSKQTHVIICHIPPGNPGNPQTLCVSLKALHTILNNGGYVFICDWESPCDESMAKLAHHLEADMMQSSTGKVLLDAYPNPFNSSTTIRFSVADEQRATLKVYDITGRFVMDLFEGTMQANQVYEVQLDGSSLAAGSYFYRLATDDGEMNVKKLMLAR